MTPNSAYRPIVLIVDDVSENLHSLKNVLRDDYAVIAATGGEKAIELALRTPQPDLILLDIKMPDMDGYEVLRRLKADPATAEIPVLFVTSLNEPLDESKGLAMGAADYITKPISPALVKVRVRAQLQLRKDADGRHRIPLATHRAPLPSLPSVLVVDDMPQNVHELVGVLSNEYRVTVANSGQKAIDIVLGPMPPDLILLDIKMPIMDGYEVCRRIKATVAGYRIPVIFVSVLDEPGAKLRGFSLGAADYITKPFDVDETRARVRNHIQLSRLRYYFEQQVGQRTAALTAMTSQLQATLNAVPDLLFEFDQDGRCQEVHAPHPELLVAPRAQLLGRLIDEVLPADASRVCMAALQEARETGWSHGKQYELVLPQGRAWFELSVSRKATIDSGQQRFIALARDITESKLAESQLRKLSLAVEQSPESIVITNLNAEIEYVNESFVQKTGYLREEIIGKNPKVLQSGNTPAETYASLWNALTHGRPWSGELHNQRKDGSQYIEHSIVTPIRQADGAITHYVAVKEDVTAKKRAEDRINSLAFFDQLTGLPNRRLLMDRLQQSLLSSARNGKQGALLLIDLDNFKTLNDTLGHEVGDLLLQQVSKRLGTCVREGDTVARLGGDEFLVIAENLSDKQTEAAAQTRLIGEKILAALNEPYQLANYPCLSTPSVGVTLFANQHESSDGLLKQVELAMYQAKTAGRNTMSFFDPAMQLEVTARAALEADLRDAILNGQFVLHYQAQVSADGRATGAEVLLRWCHPERGMVLPGQFIELAEKTGLILPIGRWVLKTACQQLNSWAQSERLSELTIAVNISVRQFRMPGFVDEVLDVLNSSGANPQRLKLELTESLLVEDVQDVSAKMLALRNVGVGFSLDDFGTGYSSLAYLKRLPLDQLKIDQGFVRDMLIDANDAAIAKMVIALADSMGLQVIAEGVETREQQLALAEMGCHAYQGYLYSKPVALQEFEAWSQKA